MNETFTLQDVKWLVIEFIKSVTPENWRKVVEHIQEKVENVYWVAEAVQEESVEQLLIEIGAGSGETDDDSSSGDDGSDPGSFSDSNSDLEV